MQTDLTDIGQRMTLTLVHLLSMFNVSAIARWIVVADCAMFAYARGSISCECTTEECLLAEKKTCVAAHFCYSEVFNGVLTRGCMDDRSSLLCENKKPSVVGIDNWPTLQCCNDKDLCNVGVTHRQIAVNGQHVDGGDHYDSLELSDNQSMKRNRPANKQPHQTTSTLLHISQTAGDQVVRSTFRCDDAPRTANGLDPLPTRCDPDKTITINPIYVAVPLGCVCILLAMIIFVSYILQERRCSNHDRQGNSSISEVRHRLLSVISMSDQQEEHMKMKREEADLLRKSNIAPSCRCDPAHDDRCQMPCGVNQSARADNQRSSTGNEAISLLHI